LNHWIKKTIFFGGVLLMVQGMIMNVALGAKYSLDLAPNYPLCVSANDLSKLTDGVYATTPGVEEKGEGAPSYAIWTSDKTVGWALAVGCSMTVDLQKVQSISGVSFSTAAGISGVRWPERILIGLSDDGKDWFFAGDLIDFFQRREFYSD
jgi:hypothetical protein